MYIFYWSFIIIFFILFYILLLCCDVKNKERIRKIQNREYVKKIPLTFDCRYHIQNKWCVKKSKVARYVLDSNK